VNLVFNRIQVVTSSEIDGVDSGGHTAPRVVRVVVTDRRGEVPVTVDFKMEPRQAHDVGVALVRDAWDCARDSLRGMGETFHRLGFFR
jgi:hypothetical protein